MSMLGIVASARVRADAGQREGAQRFAAGADNGEGVHAARKHDGERVTQTRVGGDRAGRRNVDPSMARRSKPRHR